jgi:hypothetical protein
MDEMGGFIGKNMYFHGFCQQTRGGLHASNWDLTIKHDFYNQLHRRILLGQTDLLEPLKVSNVP